MILIFLFQSRASDPHPVQLQFCATRQAVFFFFSAEGNASSNFRKARFTVSEFLKTFATSGSNAMTVGGLAKIDSRPRPADTQSDVSSGKSYAISSGVNFTCRILTRLAVAAFLCFRRSASSDESDFFISQCVGYCQEPQPFRYSDDQPPVFYLCMLPIVVTPQIRIIERCDRFLKGHIMFAAIQCRLVVVPVEFQLKHTGSASSSMALLFTCLPHIKS